MIKKESQNKIYMIIAWILSWFISPKKQVYFSSFYGQYNDNPKQISERLHLLAPEVPIYWAKSNRNHDDFPEYVKTVDISSFDHYKMMYLSMVTVDNQLGIRTVFSSTKSFFKRYICKLITKKYMWQLNIGTWHGTPLKKVGQDIEGGYNGYKLYSTLDYMLAGCHHTKNCLNTAFPNENVRLYGTPRNDVFFKTFDIKEIKERLKLPLHKKVLLFAPTFRNNIEMSGPRQLKEIDWKKLCHLLSEKFGGEWVVVIRFHPHVMEFMNTNDCKETIVDGNLGDDMSDYLLAADCLLTDYSSSFFDFALSNKPCFLYAPDLEHYKCNERGLYLDYDSLPFPISKNPITLYESVKNYDYLTSKNLTLKFLDKIGNFEDGRASEKVVNDIIKFLT